MRLCAEVAGPSAESRSEWADAAATPATRAGRICPDVELHDPTRACSVPQALGMNFLRTPVSHHLSPGRVCGRVDPTQGHGTPRCPEKTRSGNRFAKPGVRE